jgi:hypothetical protein
MPKPAPRPQPDDQMAGVVDRLLAQLPGLQGQPIAARPVVKSGSQYMPSSAPVAASVSGPRQWLGVWFRVLLGLGLGVMMANWPYPHPCGSPLFGYLSAVLTVVLTGSWAAVSAWKHRIALAHLVALIVVLYGFALITAEVLPRTGYAVDHLVWQCDGMATPPAAASS